MFVSKKVRILGPKKAKDPLEYQDQPFSSLAQLGTTHPGPVSVTYAQR